MTPTPTRRIDYVFMDRFADAGIVVDDATVEFTLPYCGAVYVSDNAGVSARVSAP